VRGGVDRLIESVIVESWKLEGRGGNRKVYLFFPSLKVSSFPRFELSSTHTRAARRSSLESSSASIRLRGRIAHRRSSVTSVQCAT